MNALNKTTILILLFVIGAILFQNCSPTIPKNWQWETLETTGKPTPRHEAGLVAYKDKLYLLGGRRVNPTSVFDPTTNTWVEKAVPPIEIHHFQPVVYGDAIYIIGAMTGGWPNETPLKKVLIYYPEKDEYAFGHDIPEHRRRGGAGLTVYKDKIYMVGGITNGHMNGFQSWFDEYNPKTGEWRTLEDAPFPRDHFQVVMNEDKLYTFAGRTTSKISNMDMALTLSHGNVYDFKTEQWETVYNHLQIPTNRAGNFAFSWNGSVIVGGGESITQVPAHKEVEAFNVVDKTWTDWPSLQAGRHGTGFAVIGDYVYTASGCGNRGGNPELTTIERLKLPKKNPTESTSRKDNTPVYSKWHTITLSFDGEMRSEDAEYNPFLNYRLVVEFQHQKTNTKQVIRGFYAADGNAAETGATSGKVWQVRFTPDKIGKWSYKATLRKDKDIALSNDLEKGTLIPVNQSTGNFVVIPSYREGNDFRAKGRLGVENSYFKFKDSDNYFLKVGANSPENFLAFEDFDGTYRIGASNRDGEAKTNNAIHQFKAHLKDWKTGDPTWKNGKGKAIIGAVNYLASKGMNAIYFLTFNIQGDGKDVWMYANPDDFTRFDVSKLEQWEILFQYMQQKGILLHIVTQETENETLLDKGDVGKMRQLYYRELVARFGHHNGLIWNLGEENGPADFTPIAQNDEQRKAMAKFIKSIDPYQHPVIIHTHSHNPPRTKILTELLGYEYLDGLSYQQDKREQAATTLAKWKAKSKAANHEWLITMDEIGMWYTGALTDTADLNHPTLTHYVLWGTLLSGSAGVEWYFGGRHVHNDLNSEDWRQRDKLWEITHHAKVFFEQNLPYWEMQPQHDLLSTKESYCFQKPNEVYALYIPAYQKATLDLTDATGKFQIEWYNPFDGGNLQKGSVEFIEGGAKQDLGVPPSRLGEDWVLLVSKVN